MLYFQQPPQIRSALKRNIEITLGEGMRKSNKVGWCVLQTADHFFRFKAISDHIINK